MGRRTSVIAAAMRGRSQLRHRWRSWLVLTLLVGIAGGLLIGAAAGARRTASVYDRLVSESGAFDYGIFARPLDSTLSGCDEDGRTVDLANSCREEAEDALRNVLRSPLVDGGRLVTSMLVPVSTADGRSLQPQEAGEDPCFTGSGEVDVDSFDASVAGTNQPVYVSGRAPDPRRRDEAAISEGVADRLGIGVGDVVRIVPVSACDGPPKDEWPAPITVRIVGTQLSPIEVEPEAGYFLQSVAVTPALLEDLKSQGLGNPFGLVRLRPGATQRELVAAAEADGVRVEPAIVADEFAAQVEDGLGPDVTTLWVLVIVGLAAAALVLGQAVARQVQAESADLGALRAMGFTSRTLAAVGAVEGAVLGVAGGTVAAAVAFAISPLTPIGRGRDIEAHHGLRFDTLAIVGGAAIVAVSCLVAGSVAAWFVARRALARRALQAKPSPLAVWTTRARLRPPTAYGVRMALERGRASGSAPVRSGLLGIVAALAVLAGSLTFTAGLDHLLASPRLVGFNWDAMYFVEDFAPTDDPRERAAAVDDALERAAATDGVASVGFATIFAQPNVPLVEDVPDLAFMSFGADPGAIGPTVTAGRAPRRDDEILFTRHALDDAGLAIGDTVALDDEARSKFEVVGTGVLPIGDGRFDRAASVTLSGLRRVRPGAGPEVAVVAFAPGADHDRTARALARIGLRAGIPSADLDVQELVDLDIRPVESTPRLLAALMTILLVGIVVHVFVTVGRARRREIAVLRTLGFTPRQVWASTAWQATTLAAVVSVGGVLAGTVVGRAIWNAYADRLGVVPEPTIAWAAYAVVAAVALALCWFVAGIVNWRALRSNPAAELRSE
jgi:ABC-type lipoprotein release transport system permease subunit